MAFVPFREWLAASGTAAGARSLSETNARTILWPAHGEEAVIVARLAREHGVSEEAVRAVFDALRRGGGTMAQFSHADFGGMSQWSSGMTMVGDMFNDSLKAKLNAIAGELSRYLREHPVEHPDADRAVSYRSGGTRHAGSWWPQELGDPSSVGSQNDMRYAVFPVKRRLVIDDHGQDHHLRHRRPPDFRGVSSAEHGFDPDFRQPARRRPRFGSKTGGCSRWLIAARNHGDRTIIGFAALCSMTSLTPQAWKIIKTRDTSSIDRSTDLRADCLGFALSWPSAC